MKTAQTVLTVALIGAGLGIGAYVLKHKADAPIAPMVDIEASEPIDMAALYWNQHAVQSEAARMQRNACRVLVGENFYPDTSGACQAPVNCSACTTHKGIAHNAVIHASTWIRSKRGAGPDYDAMMRQTRLVFQMSMAAQRATEAGRQAYDHVTRCQRIYSGADVQCNREPK